MKTVSPIRRITSEHDASLLLHALVSTSMVTSGRLDVSPENEWLQVAVIGLDGGASVAPHAHKQRAKRTESAVMTQEAWVVLRGSIRASLFDEGDALLETVLLRCGDMLVTFRGGHAFDSPAPGTLLLECKNGPYEGRDYRVLSGAVP